ncbi:MAG: ABC transporter permease subunit [Alphaproteobacteria bacterium]|nr:ABC transporter permease subunit [Alphaproteobacteria bacterium]
MTETVLDPAPKVKPRRRVTRRSVLIADSLADWGIRIGGLSVIVAVFGIMIFLAQVVVPLFTGGRVLGQHSFKIVEPADSLVAAGLDETHAVAYTIERGGEVGLYHVASGRRLAVPALDFGGKRATAFGRSIVGGEIAFGFADGTVRFGKVELSAELFPQATLPSGLVEVGADRIDGTAVYSRISPDLFRKTAIAIALEPEQAVAEGRPIVALDYRSGGTVERPVRTFVTVDDEGVPRLSVAETRINMLTRQARTQVSTAVLPTLPAGTQVARVMVSEKGDQVYVADRGGVVFRYDTRDAQAAKLAETRDLLPASASLGAFGFLIGEQSVVLTGSDGSVSVYFRLPRAGSGTSDGFGLVLAHSLSAHKAPAGAFAPSERGKMFVTADAGGVVNLRHSTSEQTLLSLTYSGGAVRLAALGPREDSVLAVGADGGATVWLVAAPHPETTWASIFGKVWYEGYEGPEFTWQSSSGTDSFEPKLSLVPLIFGTMKATFYALLFAVPIALLAAIYTSEFVAPEVRATVKPVMEMMASLPSVVLGFIAALVLAPLVETFISSVLLAFVALPLALIVAARLWQLLPRDLSLRLGGAPKLVLSFLALAAGALVAAYGGSTFERLFFAGDTKAWANGDVGSGGPFTFLLILPFAYVAVLVLSERLLGDWLGIERAAPSVRIGLLDAFRWLANLAVAAVLAALVATFLTAVGLDARGGMVSTYVQRNTLVVGFAMGFAVIPIIYTIAEDALNSVPEHLRAASLACGATQWQTATRVILPTAMSGVFAAIMVGMGRAVGETMIVVMAAGNTPIMEWNIFSGLRALSANIAVELPEAVKDGTLYRTLFLAALTLFVMTFVVNTLAEVVRQRFRKRSAQL